MYIIISFIVVALTFLLHKYSLSQQLVQFLKQHISRQYKGEEHKYFALCRSCIQVSLCLVSHMQHLGGM